jgi:peptidoglycan/xylan/chitin deacetylase (PgdA/CDA1 family)
LTNVSLEDARKEIVGGKHKIENEIGKKISFFSYPYGDRTSYNERIKQILKENGFDCAVTANYGKNDLKNDIFELKRIRVKNEEPLWMFKYHLTGVEEGIRSFFTKY